MRKEPLSGGDRKGVGRKDGVFFYNYIRFMCERFACLYVCELGSLGQKRVSDSKELELGVVVKHPVVLEMEPRSSARAASVN